MSICPNCGGGAVIQGACASCGHGFTTTKAPRRRMRPSAKDTARGTVRRRRIVETSIAARASVSTHKAANDRRLIKSALESGPLTRDAISAITGLPINIVTPRVVDLLNWKEIRELDAVAPTRSGRLAHLLMLPGTLGQPEIQSLFPREDGAA